MCREAFKALREKYIRERTKLQQNPQHSKWELYDALNFLEPHIVPRRPPLGEYSSENFELKIAELESASDLRNSSAEYNEENSSTSEPRIYDANYYNFCQELIKLVYNCRPLWDRENRHNHDKRVKMHLWEKVAQTLNSDTNTCMLKWKGLREKYIRQKTKYSEGKEKWEFLDSLSFLDNVIHYRRKPWQQSDDSYSLTDSQMEQLSSDCEVAGPHQDVPQPCHEPTRADIKTEYQPLESYFKGSCIPDSTLDTANSLDNSYRKRLSSEANENPPPSKRNRTEDQKTPEQIFGELVAAILSTKNEAEKNVAMMQIMQILTKVNQ